jgi:hypothetical protein
MHCGNALRTSRIAGPKSAGPEITVQRFVESLPQPEPGHKPLSVWWIVVPSAIFIFLSRGLIPICIVVAIGTALWVMRTKQISPAASPSLRAVQPFLPYAPALQCPVVFVMLGGSPFAVLFVVAGATAALHYHRRLVVMLEPWWQVQRSIPMAARKPLAFAIPFLAGYFFGENASGREWSYTLLSFSVGIVLAFLILFTPPDSLRGGHRP